ncbi:MAG: tetratricopeptide repeat protein [Candidatus Gastranaerophilales bacterium]|nr:tetratricopeptide repeat protein [Candidatus Gastranaerophilales bacterium]
MQGQIFSAPINAANNAALRNNKGIMYMEMGYYNAAVNEFKIAIALNPNSLASATYYNNLGNLYFKVQDYRNARDCYKQAIRLNPVFLTYYRNLIKLYDKQGTLKQELQTQLAKIQADNKNSDAILYAGLSYAQLGNKKEAVNYLKKYTELEKEQLLSNSVNLYIKELE